MSMTRKDRMAGEIAMEIRAADGPFTSTGRYHNTAYSLEALREFGGNVVEAAITGELGPTTVKGMARHFGVRDAEVRALFEQTDQDRELNFFTKGIVRGQMREIGREIVAAGGGPLVFVRTQPTSPTTGIRTSHAGKSVFGLAPGRKIGAFESIYATFYSPGDGSREQSINLAGLIPALDTDREMAEAKVPMHHLSPIQMLSLTHPTAAMFRQAGAVDLAFRDDLPEEVEAKIYVFLQGRYEGYEESVFLASPTHTVPIVNEPGYQREAREALGNDIDIVVEAEGVSPYDRGLERRHHYRAPNGRVVENEEVRRIIDRELLSRFSGPIQVEHRDVALVLMPGELQAPLPGGRFEGGQAILQLTPDGPPRWFTLLNRSDGSRAWRGDRQEMRGRLEQLAEAVALLDAPDSNAGTARREQYRSLELFDIPMSHPSGRQNVWALAAALRQSDLPDAPLGATLL
ncbi:MAG TPA: hypothetical protein VJL81_02330 [Solirubrobacterales bacterium]|nr:hypothetical protein [Solirubrobacterales bacterium]